MSAVKKPEVVCCDKDWSPADMSDTLCLCVHAHQLCYQVTGPLLPCTLTAQVASLHTKTTQVICHDAVQNISMAAPDQLPVNTVFNLVYCLQQARSPSLDPTSTTPQHNTACRSYLTKIACLPRGLKSSSLMVSATEL